MYVPKYHAMPERQALHAPSEQHPLGAWVCNVGDQLVANHIPFVLDREYGNHGHLLGHVSRANPVWRALAQGTPSVVMFMGPNAYITPSWYPSKRAHGSAHLELRDGPCARHGTRHRRACLDSQHARPVDPLTRVNSWITWKAGSRPARTKLARTA